jgi:spermidine/putrescine transport system substrate-binding protein
MIKQARIFASTLCIALFLGMMTLPFSAAATSNTTTSDSINVYNWGMYISNGSDGYIDVNKAFTEATGIKVNYMTFDSNETMYTRLKTGGTNYDVIIPSDYMIARLIQEDMLEPLDFNHIPNYQYIDQSLRNQAYDPDNQYSVPYTWGTVGLIYNSKFVSEKDVTSWDLMWNEDYAGKILMFDNPRDSFAIAELMLGYDLNTEDESELRAAAELLKKQKPLVQSYVMDQIFDSMIREEAWIGAYYAGDFLTMAKDNEDLKFCFPDEGYNVFVDAMCIPKGAANKDAAEAYINFLCSPEISGQNMDYVGYSTPITEAKAYMDPETAASPIAYPSEETLARSSSFKHLSGDTTQLMESLWLDVKTDNASLGSNPLLYVGIAVVAALIALVVILNNNKKKKLAARKQASQR